MTNCFNYLRSAKIQSESSYPYVGYRNSCRYNSNSGITGVTGYVNVAKNSVSAHLSALAKQPLSVGVAASSSVF
jgi:hypothetical protein